MLPYYLETPNLFETLFHCLMLLGNSFAHQYSFFGIIHIRWTHFCWRTISFIGFHLLTILQHWTKSMLKYCHIIPLITMKWAMNPNSVTAQNTKCNVISNAGSIKFVAIPWFGKGKILWNRVVHSINWHKTIIMPVIVKMIFEAHLFCKNSWEQRKSKRDCKGVSNKLFILLTTSCSHHENFSTNNWVHFLNVFSSGDPTIAVRTASVAYTFRNSSVHYKYSGCTFFDVVSFGFIISHRSAHISGVVPKQALNWLSSATLFFSAVNIRGTKLGGRFAMYPKPSLLKTCRW